MQKPAKFPRVQADQFIGLNAMEGIPASTGKVVYVHSSGPSYEGFDVLTTIDAGINQCRASKGDTVVVMPGHAETITSAAAIDLDIAGITVVGMGVGNSRPVVTITSTDDTGSIKLSANNTRLLNIVVVGNDDGLTNAILVTGDNCVVDVETQDTSSLIEMGSAVRLDTANNAKLRLKHLGFTGGNAMTSCVLIDDCDNVEIEIDGYGVVSTAWVNMVDVASTNVSVRGRLYTQGITNFTRDVVDTITGSTWDADIFDASAGIKVSGGSAAALASDDASAIAAALTVPTADVTTNTNERDVIGNKTDASVTTVGTTASLVAYAKGILTANLALPRAVEKSDGAVLSGSDDLFTITGGPIKILEITGIVTTQIGAGTTNVKLQITTTDPAATVDMNAAAVDIDADAVGTSYQTINTTGIFTPVTAGYVKEANSFATTPTTFLAPIGTIKLNSDAARTGNIKWYLRYVPLSQNSRVAAAA